MANSDLVTSVIFIANKSCELGCVETDGREEKGFLTETYKQKTPKRLSLCFQSN